MMRIPSPRPAPHETTQHAARRTADTVVAVVTDIGVKNYGAVGCVVYLLLTFEKDI